MDNNSGSNNGSKLSPYERALAWLQATPFIDKGIALTAGDYLEGEVVRRKERKLKAQNGGSFTLVDFLVRANRGKQYGVNIDAGDFFKLSVFPNSEVGSLNALEGDLLAVIYEGQRAYEKNGKEEFADVFSADLDRSPENAARLAAEEAAEKAVTDAKESASEMEEIDSIFGPLPGERKAGYRHE